jgi:hypothetical protein
VAKKRALLGFHRSVTARSFSVHVDVTRHTYRRAVMDTMPRLHEDDRSDVAQSEAVEAFLVAFRDEQERYLGALQEAVSRLDRESGQLPWAAANHTRLSKQLFDAQRLIVTRRAVVDADVMRIEQATVAASEVVAQSASHPERMSAPGQMPTGRQHCGQDGSRARAAREQLSALGRAAVRTMADAEDLAGVINAAFETALPDGVVARGQLAELLDEWWSAERDDALATIDDARARSAFGRIARADAARTAGNQTEPLQLIPSSTLAVFDNPDLVDLNALLASLAASLDSRQHADVSVKAAVRAVGDLPTRIG